MNERPHTKREVAYIEVIIADGRERLTKRRDNREQKLGQLILPIETDYITEQE
jgi:hypothetical protein